VIASFIAIFTNIIIITLTIDSFQHKAIALSTSATMIINFIYLMTVLYYKSGGFSVGNLFKNLFKIVGSSIIMAVFLLFLLNTFSECFTGTLASRIFMLSIAVAGSAILYFAALHVFKVPELDSLITRFRHKISNR